MNLFKLIAYSFILSTFLNFNECNAAELAGLNFSDSISQGVLEANQVPSKLMLNGLGLRKATLFKVKVYVAGLYLESRNQDSKSIINSKQNKRITMKFLRDVGAKKIKNAYVGGFEANNENLNSISRKIAEFTKSASAIKENDVMTIDFIQDSVITKINDKLISKIKGNDFSKALLRIWLGKKPPNKSLKKGMLGH